MCLISKFVIPYWFYDWPVKYGKITECYLHDHETSVASKKLFLLWELCDHIIWGNDSKRNSFNWYINLWCYPHTELPVLNIKTKKFKHFLWVFSCFEYQERVYVLIKEVMFLFSRRHNHPIPFPWITILIKFCFRNLHLAYVTESQALGWK